jgi:hypothetical protein
MCIVYLTKIVLKEPHNNLQFSSHISDYYNFNAYI